MLRASVPSRCVRQNRCHILFNASSRWRASVPSTPRLLVLIIILPAKPRRVLAVPPTSPPTFFLQDPSFTPQRSTFLESCWPCLPKRTVIGFDRCWSFLRITPDFLIAYLIHSSPTSVHTPSHILSLSPWIPPRAIVHSKSVSALEPSLVYHSLYGQRQIRLIHDPRFLNTIADSCAP